MGGSLDAPGALDGGGGENSDPQAAVRPEGLLQREVVGVDSGEVHGRGTRNRRAIHESERSGRVDAVDGGGHARRGLVVRVGVGIDALRGITRCERDQGASLGLVDEGRAQVRRTFRF